MRAWVARKYGPPEVFEMRDLPDPKPGPGEVLVRVRAIGLNFADCMAREGVYPRVPKAPCVIGMEISGEVAALGDGVSAPSVGARVTAVPIFGGHAELVAVRATHVREIPAGLSYVEAASLAVTGLTADHALFTLGRLRRGERVAIIAAAGGVGTMAVQLAVQHGARILAVASTQTKRDLAASLGAQETVGYEEYPAALGSGVDVVLDSVGGKLFRPSWRALNADGRYILYGFASAIGARRVRYVRAALEFVRMGVIVPGMTVQTCRTLAGFNLSLVPQLADELQARFARLEARLAEGTLRPIIGAVFPFDQLPQAHALLQGRGSTGKVVVAI